MSIIKTGRKSNLLWPQPSIIDSKVDLEQHWTNNYNYENKESILTINKQKAVEQTKQNKTECEPL